MFKGTHKNCLKPALFVKEEMSGIMTQNQMCSMEMYLRLDQLYDGLDVQAGGLNISINSETVGPF